MRHEEQRAYPLRCTCGYQATDKRDLDEHVEAMTRAEDE